MFVSVLFLYLDWHGRVYKYTRPQSESNLRASKVGPLLTDADLTAFVQSDKKIICFAGIAFSLS